MNINSKGYTSKYTYGNTVYIRASGNGLYVAIEKTKSGRILYPFEGNEQNMTEYMLAQYDIAV